MSKKQKAILAVSCLAFAVILMAYPLVSNALEKRYHSTVESEYNEAVAAADAEELAQAREKTDEYNRNLYEMLSQGTIERWEVQYNELLDIGGIMGYIEIPKINVYLPIDHGTEAVTLEHSVGHLLGTSLPVGGATTHAVLSAHSGMATSKLFSDLPSLEVGDFFYLHVLGDTLAYRVDQINTVLPGETELLAIEEGQDYVTLITCVPFGVNTHRLLVRGARVAWEDVPQEEQTVQPVPSIWEHQYLLGIGTGVSLLAVSGLVYYLAEKKRGKER